MFCQSQAFSDWKEPDIFEKKLVLWKKPEFQSKSGYEKQPCGLIDSKHGSPHLRGNKWNETLAEQ